MTFSNLSEYYFLILISLAIVYSAGIYYLKSGFRKIILSTSDRQRSVSIVVSMHNEEQNASECLETLVTQEYPEDILEIIIVNRES